MTALIRAFGAAVFLAATRNAANKNAQLRPWEGGFTG